MNEQKHEGVENNEGSGKLVRQEISATQFIGPIPPPSILEHYNRVVPGAADRIIKMAEQQSRHRQELEAQVIRSDILNSRLGLIFGLVIGLSGLASGVYIVIRGQVLAGSFLGGATLVALVGTFIYGSQQRKQERESKQDE